MARLRLLGTAWRLHRVAAAALDSDTPWAEVRTLLHREVPSPAAAADDAAWAAGWACRLGRRLLGRLDGCLVRSLVTASLIGKSADVAVRIGVHRPIPGVDLLDAHAWVAVGGSAVAPDTGSEKRFQPVLSAKITRPASSGDAR